MAHKRQGGHHCLAPKYAFQILPHPTVSLREQCLGHDCTKRGVEVVGGSGAVNGHRSGNSWVGGVLLKINCKQGMYVLIPSLFKLKYFKMNFCS